MKTAKHIADRIRLMIATKQFQVGDVLPSTRELGKQLETSFHTVRKAYHQLAEEGLLRSERGRGFIVNRQNTTLDKSGRLDKGAQLIRDVLEELVGYGLDDEEVETLFQEQLNFVEWPDRLQSCASVGHTREHGRLIADTIREQVGVKSKYLAASERSKMAKFDALFLPINFYNKFRSDQKTQLLLPVFYSLDSELLLTITERASLDTLALVTSEEGSIAHLIEELKLSLKFQGSIMAGSTYGKSLPLFVRESDLVLYTPDSAGLVERQLPETRRLRIRYQLDPYSADLIRAELWDQ